MRIGILTSIPTTQRAFFVEWITRWRDQGHEVFAAAGPESGGPPNHDRVALETLSLLSQRPSFKTFASASQVQTWTSRHRLDILLVSTATASFAARLLPVSCPVIYFCHGLHWGSIRSGYKSLFAQVERLLLRRTDGVISLNQQDASWFEHFAASTPHLRLASGIGLNLSQWPSTAQIPRNDELRLVWIGSLTRRKRPLDALDVAEGARQSGLSVKLNIVGDGPMFGKLAQRARVTSGIEMHGWSSPLPHLQNANAVIHTSRWEGLPRIALEAAAVGRPLFGYDVKGVQDSPGVAELSPLGDTRAMSSAVLTWFNNGCPSVPVDRPSLDWRIAHDQVTNFMARLS